MWIEFWTLRADFMKTFEMVGELSFCENIEFNIARAA
jgi:hypothetical protein